MHDARTMFLLAVGHFRRHATRIADATAECETEKEARELYVHVWDFKREVDLVLGIAEQRLLELTPQEHRWEPYPLDSGVLKFGGGNKRTRYDQPKLISRFANGIAKWVRDKYRLQAVVDENGENVIDSAYRQMMYEAISKMAAACGATAPSFDSWRSGIASEFGIKLKDYADSIEAPATVRIEGRDRV